MRVAVCIDDNGGMLFNARRQSRDRAQQEDLLALCAGGRLWMAPYSASLFDWAAEQAAVDEAFLQKAEAGEVCFVEDRPLSPVAERIEEVVLYHWNRTYPTDTRFDLDLSAFCLTERMEFPGSSHETITRERYERRV